MKNNNSSNIQLGLFVTIGTIALIIALYLIGSNRNIFSKSITVHSHFYSVDGLKTGNNVRYAGIDIGTVSKIDLENDSSVSVYMIIEQKHSKFIRINSYAAVGTDGLMGNKIVNIYPGQGQAKIIVDGDEIRSLKPIENDEMIRTLNTTNENLAAITSDLKKFTSGLIKNKGILKLLDDSASTENIRGALQSIRLAAENANAITVQLNTLVKSINDGKGVAGILLNDSTKAAELSNTLQNLQSVSDSLGYIVTGLSEFTTNINHPEGLLYTISRDSVLSENVKDGMKNLEQSTLLLNENLKAMRSSFLFRRYFKNQEKEQKKSR